MTKRTALITGGTGGIGSAMVERFCADGHDVYFLDCQADQANEVLDRVSALPEGRGRACFVEGDLSDLVAIQAAIEEIVSEAGSIDILVNNAAIYPSKKFNEYSSNEYRQVQRINVEAAVLCVGAVCDGMIANKWGRIIQISSITAFGKFANIMPYVVSKASLIGLTRALATELGEHNITVNGICPGAIPTDAGSIQGDPDEYSKYVLEQQALKFRGTVHDIANVAAFFASDESRFVTGQMLNADGGWVMR